MRDTTLKAKAPEGWRLRVLTLFINVNLINLNSDSNDYSGSLSDNRSICMSHGEGHPRAALWHGCAWAATAGLFCCMAALPVVFS